MAGLCAPLSTLHVGPRGTPRITRGRGGWLDLPRGGLSPPILCQLSWRTPIRVKAEGRSGLVGLWTDDRQGGLTWFSVRIASAEILDAIGVLQALAFLAPRDAVLEGHNRLSMLNWRGLFSRRGLRGLLTGRWTNEECQQNEDGSASHLGTLTLKEAGRSTWLAVLNFDLDQLNARMEVADDGNPVDSCIVLPLLPGRRSPWPTWLPRPHRSSRRCSSCRRSDAGSSGRAEGFQAD